MADSPNPFSGLSGMFGKGNQSQTPSWQPQAPVTYQDGQWMQNGKPVGPVTGGASQPGFSGGQGAFSNAMQYLQGLRKPVAPPATATGMQLPAAPPAQNGSQQNQLIQLLLGLKSGNAAGGNPSSLLAQALAGGQTPAAPAAPMQGGA